MKTQRNQIIRIDLPVLELSFRGNRIVLWGAERFLQFAYLAAENNNLWQLYRVRAHRVEDVLQLVYNWD